MRSENARPPGLQRSSEVTCSTPCRRRNHWSRCPRGGFLRLQPRHRGWTANVSLPERGGVRGDSASVERQQRLPRDCPQDRHRQAQSLGDPTHVGTGATAERGFLLKVVPTNDNVADLMTKHLVGARIEELLAKLGVRRCARGLVVVSLFTNVGANHIDACADHVTAANLAHEVILPWGARFWCSYWLRWQLLGHAAVGSGVFVTPPLESARSPCRGTKASVRQLS